VARLDGGVEKEVGQLGVSRSGAFWSTAGGVGYFTGARTACPLKRELSLVPRRKENNRGLTLGEGNLWPTLGRLIWIKLGIKAAVQFLVKKG